MKNSGIRIKVKASDTYSIGGGKYDLLQDNEYCFINMSSEDIVKVKSSINSRLESFKVTTDTSKAFQTFIYQPVDRLKNFQKAAGKMPKRRPQEKKQPEIKTEVKPVIVEKVPDFKKSIETFDGEEKLVIKDSNEEIISIEDIPVVGEENEKQD